MSYYRYRNRLQDDYYDDWDYYKGYGSRYYDRYLDSYPYYRRSWRLNRWYDYDRYYDRNYYRDYLWNKVYDYDYDRYEYRYHKYRDYDLDYDYDYYPAWRMRSKWRYRNWRDRRSYWRSRYSYRPRWWNYYYGKDLLDYDLDYDYSTYYRPYRWRYYSRYRDYDWRELDYPLYAKKYALDDMYASKASTKWGSPEKTEKTDKKRSKDDQGL